MAANIEQIFQDFILSKIKEIEHQNEDVPANEVPCAEMEKKEDAAPAGPEKEKEDSSKASGSRKKHKKHKKHKSKKKKRNRDNEGESSSDSTGEQDGSKHQTRRGTPTQVDMEQGDEKKSKSKGHKKKKKKKRKRKGEDNSSDSDSDCVSKKRHRESGQSPRQGGELPDIIPKLDSSNKERRDEGKVGRESRRSGSRSHSQSHSDYHSHSCSGKRCSHSGCGQRRRSRSQSLSSSQRHRTRSRSSDKKGEVVEKSTQLPQGTSTSDQPPQPTSSPPPTNMDTQELSDSSKAEHQEPDHSEKPAETKETKAEESIQTPAAGSGTSESVRNQSVAPEPDTTTGPSSPRPKAAECHKYLVSEEKSPARRTRKSSKSPSRRKERKSSRSKKRSKSPSRSRRRRSRTRSPSRRTRTRSRSGGRTSRRSRSWSRSRKRPTYGQRDRWKREPSRSPVLILRKDRSPPRKHGNVNNSPQQRVSELDKEQLLEIAKANAAAMCAKAGMPIPAGLRTTMLPMALPSMAMNAAMASMTAATMTAALSNMGTLSSFLSLPSITNKPPPSAAQPNMAALEEVKRKVTKQANSISIKEFTDKCKMIVDSKGELPVAVPHVSDEEDDGKPFGGAALREQKAISFSINNMTVRPAVRSDAGIAKEFPVSSGSQHRKKVMEGETLGAYGEWVPVEKSADKGGTRKAQGAAVPSAPGTAASGERGAAGSPEAVEQPVAVSDSVFPDPVQPVDISQAVTERIKAQRRLAENPYDVNAICALSRAQEQVDAWAQSSTVPGLFTGTTGAQVLTSEELSNNGGPQAWLKKDQFLRAAPVSGGVGEFLMRKMGWRTGEGLGRNREGTVEPIIIDFKVDRKGLVAEGEKPQKQTGGLVVTKDMMGKHPVSALIEHCNKKRMMQPDFVMVHHSGPDHRKNFLFKVTVNGVDYQPQTASPNKKHAKAMAATVALQALGEVPADGPGLYTGPVFTAASTGPLFST